MNNINEIKVALLPVVQVANNTIANNLWNAIVMLCDFNAALTTSQSIDDHCSKLQRNGTNIYN